MAQTPPRILVVDDVADNRDLLRRQFERNGFAVSTARSGQAALDLLQQVRCQLVLLDINMPDMDGVEVLKRLRELYPPTTLPVIMLTASNQIADVVRAKKFGANDYIMKPVDIAIAVSRVRHALGKAARAAAI